MLISELAKIVGLHPETIRRLERRGVIPAAKRDANGWRQYSQDVVRLLKNRYGRNEEAQSAEAG